MVRVSANYVRTRDSDLAICIAAPRSRNQVCSLRPAPGCAVTVHYLVSDKLLIDYKTNRSSKHYQSSRLEQYQTTAGALYIRKPNTRLRERLQQIYLICVLSLTLCCRKRELE